MHCPLLDPRGCETEDEPLPNAPYMNEITKPVLARSILYTCTTKFHYICNKYVILIIKKLLHFWEFRLRHHYYYSVAPANYYCHL